MCYRHCLSPQAAAQRQHEVQRDTFSAIQAGRCQRMLEGSPCLVTAVAADSDEHGAVLFQNNLSRSYYADEAVGKLLRAHAGQPQPLLTTLFSQEGPEMLQASPCRERIHPL